MKKTTLVLISALSLAACATAKPIEVKGSPKPEVAAPDPLQIKPSLPASLATNPYPNPFKNQTEEDLFWKVMNGEVDNLTEDAPPLVNIAVLLRVAMSPRYEDDARTKALIMLTNLAIFYIPSQNLAEMDFNLLNTDPVVSWNALRIVSNLNFNALAIVNYVLNDDKNMSQWLANETAAIKKMQTSPKEKTAPTPDTGKTPKGDGIPTQTF